MSYKPEVLVDGEWCGNGLAFATEQEALIWGKALLGRWFVPVDNRALESDEAVNYTCDEFGTAKPV